MSISPNVFDYAIVVFLAVAGIVELLLMPAFRKQRVRGYAYMMSYLWISGIGVLVQWSLTGRPWSALFLGPAPAWRLGLGFAIAAGYVAYMTRHHSILIKPKVRPQVARAMASVEWMMPRTSGERIMCAGLSVAAGTNEEIIFRGFALALLGHFVGLWGAIPLSAVAFGLGHAYQDRKAILPTTVFGVAMTGLVLISGSLFPAIALHIFNDLVLTDAGYYAFADPP
ncbi:MAG TPA: type II CAAX endopeptidase family protein [Candidatus Baltobacteraceae bacterium]|jgi:membrane protease YdiL (CAAX protease family)|nr:type II CAAX endopeptidase family protein [Candidatus Baltobacteraceae bacterium]